MTGVQTCALPILPDSQRLVLEVARIVKTGILQQNAFHKDDSFVPLEKQYKMLKVVWNLYVRANECAEKGIPMSRIKDTDLFEKIVKMKYTIPNDNLDGIKQLIAETDAYYDALLAQYN